MNTIVFLGPSLSLEKAKQILPDALYLPPVKCGDILDVLKLQPKKIAIIDGYFESVAAVWHKEILFALENQVEVYGASSMGALRAAELADFGMIGSGKIFDDFYQGKLEDDDEVTVVHRPVQSGYTPITDAMVNIRYTLEKAVRENIIDIEISDKLIVISKNLFYKKRYLNKILEIFEKKYGVFEIENFQQWLNLKKENFVDQKENDAINLLEVLNQNTNQIKRNYKFNMSIMLKKLLDRHSCEPTAEDGDLSRYVRLLAYTLKSAEKLGLSIKNNQEITSFTYGLSVLFDIDVLENSRNSKVLLFCGSIIFNLYEHMKSKEIALSEQQQKNYLEEIREFLPECYNKARVSQEQLVIIYFVLKDMMNNSMDCFLSQKSSYFPGGHYVERAKEIIFSL